MSMHKLFATGLLLSSSSLYASDYHTVKGHGTASTLPEFVRLNAEVHSTCYDSLKAALAAARTKANQIAEVMEKYKGDAGKISPSMGEWNNDGRNEPKADGYGSVNVCKGGWAASYAVSLETPDFDHMADLQVALAEITGEPAEDAAPSAWGSTEDKLPPVKMQGLRAAAMTNVSVSKPVGDISLVRREALQNEALRKAKEDADKQLDVFRAEHDVRKNIEVHTGPTPPHHRESSGYGHREALFAAASAGGGSYMPGFKAAFPPIVENATWYRRIKFDGENLTWRPVAAAAVAEHQQRYFPKASVGRFASAMGGLMMEPLTAMAIVHAISHMSSDEPASEVRPTAQQRRHSHDHSQHAQRQRHKHKPSIRSTICAPYFPEEPMRADCATPWHHDTPAPSVTVSPAPEPTASLNTPEVMAAAIQRALHGDEAQAERSQAGVVYGDVEVQPIQPELDDAVVE